MDQLEKLTTILGLTLDELLSGQPTVLSAVRELLQCAQHPFKKKKASDEIHYAKLLPAFWTSLARFVEYDDRDLKFAVVDTVAACSKPFEQQKPEDAKVENPNLAIFERSDAITYIVEALRYAQDYADEQLIKATIFCIRDLSVNALLCGQIADAGGLYVMSKQVGQSDIRDELYPVVVECIWNVLELDGTHAASKFESQEMVCFLREAYHRIAQDGYRQQDKILRNEILVLASYIAKWDGNKPFFMSPTDFLDVILMFSITDELSPPNKNNSSQKVTAAEDVEELNGSFSAPDKYNATYGSRGSPSSPSKSPMNKTGNGFKMGIPVPTVDDLELKKFSWILISELSSEPEAIPIIAEYSFIPALLSYIDWNHVQENLSRWPKPYVYDTQLQSLKALSVVAPLLPEIYQEFNGNMCMLHFLSAQQDEALRVMTLRVLHNTVSLLDFAMEIGEAGGIEILLKLLQSAESSIRVKELCVSILSKLCTNCAPNQRQLRKKGGIDILRKYLRYDTAESIEIPVFLTLATVDCIWNSVVGNKKNESAFLDVEGVHGLLDLLEVAPEMIKRQVLSCLVDFFNNRKAARLFHDWHSEKTMESAAQLSIRLYVSEEQRLGLIDEKGCITNLYRPIAPPKEAKQKIKSLEDSKGFERLFNALKETGSTTPRNGRPSTPSKEPENVKRLTNQVTQVDLREKVYAVFSKVGFSSHNDLTLFERQKLRLIEMWPTFRVGERWNDIKDELQLEDIKPTSDDNKWMEDCIESSRYEAQMTREDQEQMVREKEENGQNELNMFYTSLKQHREKEAELQRMLQDKSKTLKRTLTMKDRQTQKQLKESMIKNSFMKQKTMETHAKTQSDEEAGDEEATMDSMYAQQPDFLREAAGVPQLAM
eukprot:GILJ01006923.1.p1 GENE.GILJ01006923.1~~GILJ01006923.1.p1  ORF type:complete len:958 (-),score=179.61 GILJ01006923.1:144-2795(-)